MSAPLNNYQKRLCNNCPGIDCEARNICPAWASFLRHDDEQKFPAHKVSRRWYKYLGSIGVNLRSKIDLPSVKAVSLFVCLVYFVVNNLPAQDKGATGLLPSSLPAFLIKSPPVPKLVADPVCTNDCEFKQPDTLTATATGTVWKSITLQLQNGLTGPWLTTTNPTQLKTGAGHTGVFFRALGDPYVIETAPSTEASITGQTNVTVTWTLPPGNFTNTLVYHGTNSHAYTDAFVLPVTNRTVITGLSGTGTNYFTVTALAVLGSQLQVNLKLP